MVEKNKVVRIRPDVHQQLKEIAKSEKRTIKGQLETIVSDYIEKHPIIEV